MNDIELNIIHDIEELAELQKELTKALRGKLRLLKLEEEMADVFISLYNIIDLFNLDLKNLNIFNTEFSNVAKGPSLRAVGAKELINITVLSRQQRGNPEVLNEVKDLPTLPSSGLTRGSPQNRLIFYFIQGDITSGV